MSVPWGAIAQGVVQAGSQYAQQRMDDNKGPSQEDPETRGFYEDMRKRMDSPETDPVYQAGKRRNEQMVARSQREIARMTGGDVAATQNAMLQAQREGATNLNQLMGQQGQRQQYFTGLASQLQQRIAQRKLELQQYDRVQSEAQKTQASRRGRANMNAIMTMLNDRQNEQGGGQGLGGSSGGGSGGMNMNMDSGGPDAYAPEAGSSGSSYGGGVT